MTKGKLFRSAIMAGIAIGIAGFGYLALGGIAGAIFSGIFAFALTRNEQICPMGTDVIELFLNIIRCKIDRLS